MIRKRFCALAVFCLAFVQGGQGAWAACSATSNDGLTVQTSGTDDAAVLRAVVAAAPLGGTVKVAGHCQGAILEGGTTQVLRLTQAVSVVGGFAPPNWTTSDPIANPTSLDGQDLNRVVLVDAPGATVTLRNMTIERGRTTVFNDDGAGARILSPAVIERVVFTNNTVADTSSDGGGLYLTGPVGSAFSIVDSQFLNNTAGSSGQGGGIYVLAADNLALAMQGNTFTGNYAGTGGGLVVNGGSTGTTVSIQRHTFSQNSTDTGGSGGAMFLAEAAVTIEDTTCSNNTADYGGGCIYLAGDTNLTVRRSTFSGNQAAVGGAIRLQNASNAATIENSTFSANQAVTNLTSDARGGAIEVSEGTLTVRNSTLSGNGASGTGAVGGTLWSSDDGTYPTVNLVNSVLANTSTPAALECGREDPLNHILNVTNSRIEDGSCGQPASADPQLGPLANNGGLTLTLLPAAGSPLIDAGAACLATDQRGIVRPQGPACDIGAVEVVAAAAPGDPRPVPVGGLIWWLLMAVGVLGARVFARR
ncbi:MAG: right-handed parallel beta-helix repeat-containing protein [Betaproteobacteria bacterium]|nr:right-handed parallel beta-helix repeat-containing protein [Betaproteobacteria bacterium]